MKTTDVGVRFECGSENRMSEDFGPYDYAQLTYGELRVCDPGGDHDYAVAYYFNGMWELEDGTRYSDVVIYGVIPEQVAEIAE